MRFEQRYVPPKPSSKLLHRFFCLFSFVFKTYWTAWDLLVTLTNFQVTLTILWVTLTSLLRGKAFFFSRRTSSPFFLPSPSRTQASPLTCTHKQTKNSRAVNTPHKHIPFPPPAPHNSHSHSHPHYNPRLSISKQQKGDGRTFYRSPPPPRPRTHRFRNFEWLYWI